jgi:hypothetical protein
MSNIPVKKTFGDKFKFLIKSEDFTVGSRKTQMTLYILHRLWLGAILEFLIYILMVTQGGFSNADTLALLGTMNIFILSSSGMALGIYSYGDTQEWKYRGQNNNMIPPMWNNVYNPNQYGPDAYGGGGQGAYTGPGGNAININVAKPNPVGTVPVPTTGPPIAPNPTGGALPMKVTK